MNYLQLCQQANLYGGFQGTISSVDSSGYQALLVDAVRKAWAEIQKERSDWDFMYAGVDIPLTAAATVYTPEMIFGSTVAEVGTWDHDLMIYNYNKLKYIPYKEFLLKEDNNTGEPSYFTENTSDQSLIFNSVDTDYTVTAQYTKTPQLLTNNTDVPQMPPKHHQIIVYAAVLELAAYVSSAEVYQKNQINYSKAMGQLMRDHCPARKIRQRPAA